MQVYLSLYTMLGCVADQVSGGASILSDSMFISSLKVISAVLALSSISVFLAGNILCLKQLKYSMFAN